MNRDVQCMDLYIWMQTVYASNFISNFYAFIVLVP